MKAHCKQKSIINKRKTKKRANVVHRDALAREHSKRHGNAVKKGIKKAQEVRHAALRATSRAKGKSKAQVVAESLFDHANKCE